MPLALTHSCNILRRCDPDGACHMGWSPLFEATQYDTLAAITALGSAKANIDAFGPTMATALQSAVAKEDVGMIATLLAAKASPVCFMLYRGNHVMGRAHHFFLSCVVGRADGNRFDGFAHRLGNRQRTLRADDSRSGGSRWANEDDSRQFYK